ncbi:MAG: alpha/beta fold hydrolase [Austwickia sp.]|nr:alpha/beta fold hydrolase [Austwickia sp.]MBK9102354.1 alpha/beta fold hydrolase [Austwickia sp.]
MSTASPPPAGPTAPDSSPPSPGGPALLVFLHGIGSNPMSFSEQVAKLPAGVEAVCPWLRGTRPGAKDAVFTLEAAAGEVITTLELAGVGAARAGWLCGVSAGAMVALAVAQQRPDLVSSLVLVGGQVAPSRSALAVQSRIMRLIPRSAYAAKGLDKRRTLAALDDLSRADLRAGLSRVTASTLVVCGGRDRVNLPAARQLADGISGARLEIVAGAGHEVNVDRPREFNDLLYGFLGAG